MSTSSFCNLENLQQLPVPSGGYCRRCHNEHRLGPGDTLAACRRLMEDLERQTTIDLFPGSSSPDPALTTDYLFGPARGKMFGILEGRDQEGQRRFLYAFSGQYNGRWLVDGWVPPLFDTATYASINEPAERRIKEIGGAMARWREAAEHYQPLRRERAALSRQLMRDLHHLYRLRNFRGEEVSMAQAFVGGGGMPTGTGDCCAPKLLGAALRLGLYPLGLSEFYWGRENRAGTRHHGEFSPACPEKCAPILGYMLCGLECREGPR